MYEDTTGCCSDPNSISLAAGAEATVNEVSENGFSQSIAHISSLPSFPQPLMAGSNGETHHNFDENLNLPMDELSYHHHHHHHHREGDAMELEFQQQVAGFNNSPHDTNNPNLVQEVANWDPNQMQEMGHFNHHHHQTQDPQFHDSTLAYNSQAPDLLNFFNMPRCSNSSLLPNSSISFSNLGGGGGGFVGSDVPTNGVDNSNPSATSLSILYDPLFHLNLPPQPPLFRELFHSLPHGFGLPASSRGGRGGSLFGEGDIEREGSGGIYEDGDGSGVLEFTRDMTDCIGKGRDGKMTKHFATERQRRVQLNDKYKALRSLVPNPTKTDRASIVGDAIEYIKELLRTVKELKLLVEKKRCSRERSKRHRTAEEDGSAWDVESSNVKPLGDAADDQTYNLRSSWLQRKSKDTEVDVRIIDDEVTIKLVQRKVNCLLLVSKLLDELQLDLHHVAGGHIGDYYSFVFNTKIYEGSSVYASAIANKLIDVLERQQHHSSLTPQTNSY